MSLEDRITSQYEEFRKYVPTCFTDSPSSYFNAFIKALSDDQAKFLSEWDAFGNNINVLTADTNGVSAWEYFLELPQRPDLSLQARRGRLFSRMTPLPCTMKTIKDVVKGYIGTTNFIVREYYTLNDPVSAFYYEVEITEPYTANFVRTDLEDDLKRLQPAHCRLVQILDTFRYIEDSETQVDSVTTQLISVFLADSSPTDNPDYVVL